VSSGFGQLDKKVQKYRLWGFQTLPIMPDNGGEIRFEGDEMITDGLGQTGWSQLLLQPLQIRF